MCRYTEASDTVSVIESFESNAHDMAAGSSVGISIQRLAALTSINKDIDFFSVDYFNLNTLVKWKKSKIKILI